MARIPGARQDPTSKAGLERAAKERLREQAGALGIGESMDVATPPYNVRWFEDRVLGIPDGSKPEDGYKWFTVTKTPDGVRITRDQRRGGY